MKCLTMFKRPKVGETEEDLLRQEDEFLKQSGKQSSRKIIHDSEPKIGKNLCVPGIVGDIVEKNQKSITVPDIKNEAKGKGFPSLFHIDASVGAGKRGKKSLFALHLEKAKNLTEDSSKEVDVLKPVEELGEAKKIVEDVAMYENGFSSLSENSDSLNNLKESVHQESVKKLSSMTEDEILNAQRKLYETLDPKLINLLKIRGKLKEKTEKKNTAVPEEVEMKELDLKEEDEEKEEEEIELKETLSNYVGEKWVNMDFLEREKLEWVGDIPDSKCLEPDKPYSARFDFKGDLQPFRCEIDVTKSLHHHGDEPERPGYTIQELYQLSRSAVLQQRILALNAIANIIRKSKLGHYDLCFDGYLLHKLLESDLFLLLRFSIDENALIPSAINCLRRLIYNDTDEYCLDKLLGTTDDDAQPLIYDKMEVSNDEEKELKDYTIINCDVIKGILRTDLIVRICYILNNVISDREAVTNSILCLIRVLRHSIESSMQILNKPDILNFVYSSIKCDKPIYQGVKLFRLLIGQSRKFASHIAANYPMKFLISYVNEESMTEIPKTDFYLLKLESLYLWRNFLKHGFMLDEFISWTPCFIRLLQFYVGKVDFYGEGDFDFEMFSAMLSCLRVCVRNKFDTGINYVAVLGVCLEKWLKQLMKIGKFNFAGMKALGNCFAFFTDYFKSFGADKTGLGLIKKFNYLVSSLIKSPAFESISKNLVVYSHVLNGATVVKRDPSNLPSLCSVYEGGNEFLKIVKNESSLPFFISFVKYLKCSYSVTHECSDSFKSFTESPYIRKYLAKILKSRNNTDNWFAMYELMFLADLLQLFHQVSNSEVCLKLGFRLLPMLRVDDENSKYALSVITDKKAWSSNGDFFNCLLQVYLDNVYKPVADSDCVLRYKTELVGEEWTYGIFSYLRGKEAVAENGKALSFINEILNNNPGYLERVSHTHRFYYLCMVFLTDSNVFDDDIQNGLKNNIKNIIDNTDKINLNDKVDGKKSFYDLYTELINQYAAVSYGLDVFAKFVLFPLQNRFDVSFKKLIWFEYLHVLRVVTLPYPTRDFIDLNEFSEPCETDESLLVAYLNSVSNNVITKNRNPFVYNIAVSNVKNYLRSGVTDAKLSNFLRQKINNIKNERIREDLGIV